MTALSASLDLATLANCPPAQDRHRLDCLVRWLIDNGWPGAVTLGATEPLTIVAGIGTLKIGPDLLQWEPVKPSAPTPMPAPAPEALRQQRQAACDQCPRYEHGRCTVAGCGCAGQGTPGALFSKCPLAKWPS